MDCYIGDLFQFDNELKLYLGKVNCTIIQENDDTSERSWSVKAIFNNNVSFWFNIPNKNDCTIEEYINEKFYNDVYLFGYDVQNIIGTYINRGNLVKVDLTEIINKIKPLAIQYFNEEIKKYNIQTIPNLLKVLYYWSKFINISLNENFIDDFIIQFLYNRGIKIIT